MNAPSAFSLTDIAATKVRELLRAQDRDGQSLRVYIQGGGCSGFQYGFNFEEGSASDDSVLNHEGVQVVVDPMQRDVPKWSISCPTWKIPKRLERVWSRSFF